MELPFLSGRWTLEAAEVFLPEGDVEGLKGAYGRGGVFRVGSTVVRPYRRGGLLGKVIQRRYAGAGRFQAEAAIHRALWEAGFPTVQPLGCAWRRRLPWGVEGAYFTEAAPGRPWPQDWAGGEETLRQLWSRIEELCAWGLWSPDLNATNVLVQPDGALLLLDWDRACWDSSPDLPGRYKGRLVRSLRKLSAPENLLHVMDALCP